MRPMEAAVPRSVSKQFALPGLVLAVTFVMAFSAPVARAQVVPATTINCKFVSGSDTIQSTVIGNVTDGLYGPANNQFLVDFSDDKKQLTNFTLMTNPGKGITYAIVQGPQSTSPFTNTAIYSFVQPQNSAPYSLGPLPNGAVIGRVQLCFGGTAPAPSTLSTPKCEQILTGVTCNEGFNGVVLLTKPAQTSAQLITNTLCTCGSATTATQCNASDPTAADACVKALNEGGGLHEIPDAGIITNGGANSTLICLSEGSTRSCFFVTTAAAASELPGDVLPKCSELAGTPVTCSGGFSGAALLTSQSGNRLEERLCTCGANTAGVQCEANVDVDSGLASCADLIGELQELPDQFQAVDGTYTYCPPPSGGTQKCRTIRTTP